MRTAVYVDGFNLYFGVLKRTPYKWLDLQRLFESVLTRNRVTSIRYFTARVLATPRNPAVHVRQDTYLRALQAACPLLTIHYGHYVRREMSMENAAPPPATVGVGEVHGVLAGAAADLEDAAAVAEVLAQDGEDGIAVAVAGGGVWAVHAPPYRKALGHAEKGSSREPAPPQYFPAEQQRLRPMRH